MNTTNSYSIRLIIYAAIILFIWIFYPFAAVWLQKTESLDFFEKIGPFGDSFGALNTLFAGLAFAGIIVTIRQQSEDLKSTQQEIKNTNREFARQIIENALFGYANFMRKVLPTNHLVLIAEILRETERFNELAKQYEQKKTTPSYWLELEKCINSIREKLKEFATWRSTFAGWCRKINSEMKNAAWPEELNDFEKHYQSRLWELLTKDERRVLFLQFAFYIDPATNKDWINHEKLASKTKCMERFTVNFDKKSYNALLRALHLPGKREIGYKLEDGTKLKELMNEIHTAANNQLTYELPKEEKKNKDTSSQ